MQLSTSAFRGPNATGSCFIWSCLFFLTKLKAGGALFGLLCLNIISLYRQFNKKSVAAWPATWLVFLEQLFSHQFPTHAPSTSPESSMHPRPRWHDWCFTSAEGYPHWTPVEAMTGWQVKPMGREKAVAWKATLGDSMLVVGNTSFMATFMIHSAICLKLDSATSYTISKHTNLFSKTYCTYTYSCNSKRRDFMNFPFCLISCNLHSVVLPLFLLLRSSFSRRKFKGHLLTEHYQSVHLGNATIKKKHESTIVTCYNIAE